jgi:hypothetical protein
MLRARCSLAEKGRSLGLVSRGLTGVLREAPSMDKQVPERRRATRLECNIPILVRGRSRTLRAHTADLSRVGTLLRIPLEELGLTRDVSLAVLGREAMASLGEVVTIELHYEALGNLISHTARPMRMSRALPGQEFLEIGLDLTKPLSNMETEFLGIALPPLFHEVDLTWEPEDSNEEASASRADVAVVICSADDDVSPPLRVRPSHLSADGVRANLGPVENLPMLVDGGTAADVLTALADGYGGEPQVVIFADDKPVWSGASRLQALEVCPWDGRAKLQMAFPQRLPACARARLGIPA